MNIFETIKQVLDELYDEISGDEAAKDKRICESLRYLNKWYFNPTEIPLDYTKPEIRFAYIYKYTPAHACYIQKIIRNSNELTISLNKENSVISCIGGGPGSDFLGVLKYLVADAKKVSGNVTCYLYDREDSWGESWGDISSKLPEQEFRFSPIFQSLDVYKKQSWQNKKKYLQSDLVILSYFASEIFHQADDNAYLKHLFKASKNNSYFLFLDIASSNIYTYIDEISENYVEVLMSENSHDIYPDYDEEKTSLGIYFEKFKIDKCKGTPKLKSKIAYRVYKKVK